MTEPVDNTTHAPSPVAVQKREPLGMKGEELVRCLCTMELLYQVDGGTYLNDFEDCEGGTFLNDFEDCEGGPEDDADPAGEPFIRFSWESEMLIFEERISYAALDVAEVDGLGNIHCKNMDGEDTVITIFRVMQVSDVSSLLEEARAEGERQQIEWTEHAAEQRRRECKHGLYGSEVDDAN